MKILLKRNDLVPTQVDISTGNGVRCSVPIQLFVDMDGDQSLFAKLLDRRIITIKIEEIKDKEN